MNLREKQMVDLLIDLKENHHVVGVKAEFEAEGTRLEEAMRLKEVSLKAGLGMTLKIGGCEAIRDMFEAANLGVVHLVAPMVETAYALKKYLNAVNIAFSKDLQNDVDFLINLETITSCRNFEEMLQLPEIARLKGIVLGRVDLTGSMNLTREDINSDQVKNLCLEMAAKAKAHGKVVVVGGGVSVHSLPFFRSFPPGHIDRYETRKVVFSCPGALENKEAAFLKAVEFEISWLKNKKEYYTLISQEDDARLVMMEQRYQKQIQALSAAKA
ncbi:MAG: aldolase [Candidatus Methylacidiphilales bacterium]|nr:aldolase [Candidatus Methylacidiphilales bacterium]